MHRHSTDTWRHDHSFGQENPKAGEQRTAIVIVITASMMIIEIVGGIVFGSMALLADGLHMASHAVALSVALMGYIFARRYANDERFSFGTGKANALAAFTSAVLLGVFAALMAWESVVRFVNPVQIIFNQAIFVAVVGLVVNVVCMFILGSFRELASGGNKGLHHEDHNLKAAYFHVLADALTSVLAIAALTAAKYYGLNWMDPLVGVVGAVLVGRWSLGLVRTASRVLLDRQAPDHVLQAIREAVESVDDNEIADLHVWSIGPALYAGSISVVTDEPKQPDYYKELLPKDKGLVHTTIEVHCCEALDD